MKTVFLLGILLIMSNPSALLAQTKNNIPVKPKPKITFIELGSVNCIPCKQMQPVMKAIEEKYGDAVSVVFYDVWTRAQQSYARQYNIRLIPTQVFLDENGKEFFRHEGFYPEEEIHALFKQRGVMPKRIGG
ncbi:MAG: thioredoxin family protein [Bacteroidota bacterium]